MQEDRVARRIVRRGVDVAGHGVARRGALAVLQRLARGRLDDLLQVGGLLQAEAAEEDAAVVQELLVEEGAVLLGPGGEAQPLHGRLDEQRQVPSGKSGPTLTRVSVETLTARRRIPPRPPRAGFFGSELSIVMSASCEPARGARLISPRRIPRFVLPGQPMGSSEEVRGGPNCEPGPGQQPSQACFLLESGISLTRSQAMEVVHVPPAKKNRVPARPALRARRGRRGCRGMRFLGAAPGLRRDRPPSRPCLLRTSR